MKPLEINAIFGTDSSLSIRIEGCSAPLEPTGDGKWLGKNLLLTFELEKVGDVATATPFLTNQDEAETYVDHIDIVETTIGKDEDVKFLRFGLNMPGDPVRFGTLTANGVVPPPSMLEGSIRADADGEFGVVSHSLLAFSLVGSDEVALFGNASFTKSEGTYYLIRDDATGTCRFRCRQILDGVALGPGQTIQLDGIHVATGSDLNDLLTSWADVTARNNGARVPAAIPTGWNDWQYYRNDKTQRDVLDSAEVIADLKRQGFPLEFIQVDGGFCAHLSEWTVPKPEFSDGVQALSDNVRRMGLQFGLWLAPYIQNAKTKVVKNHPDWLLEDENSDVVELPNSNVGRSHLIDYTVSGTLDWLAEQVDLFVNEWGVTWIKLDGPNYALYRQGRLRDRSKTITEMLAETFEVIRTTAGDDVLIEGEGPMGVALGRVDLHRVQTDNHPTWFRGGDARFPYAEAVYGKELIMAFLHERWWVNHRENVVLRNHPSPHHHGKTSDPHKVEPMYTENEMNAQLASAFLSPGGLLLTDPMKELIRLEDRMERVTQILPVWPKAATMIDVFPGAAHASIYACRMETPFDSYHVLGVINWSDATKDFNVPLDAIATDRYPSSSHVAFSFFDQKFVGEFTDSIQVNNVPAHGAAIVAVREHRGIPWLLSTDMHMAQGAVELSDVRWNAEEKTLTVEATHFSQKDRRMWFFAPEDWRIAAIQTNAVRYSIDDFDERTPSIRFDGAAGNETTFEIHWKS